MIGIVVACRCCTISGTERQHGPGSTTATERMFSMAWQNFIPMLLAIHDNFGEESFVELENSDWLPGSAAQTAAALDLHCYRERLRSVLRWLAVMEFFVLVPSGWLVFAAFVTLNTPESVPWTLLAGGVGFLLANRGVAWNVRQALVRSLGVAVPETTWYLSVVKVLALPIWTVLLVPVIMVSLPIWLEITLQRLYQLLGVEKSIGARDVLLVLLEKWLHG